MDMQRNWEMGDVAELAMQAMRNSIQWMEGTPGSSVDMCHRQGKSAVYLAHDMSIVDVPPAGARDESLPASASTKREGPDAGRGQELLIIIGANGAGKTTLGRAHRAWLPRPYYNVDVIAEGLGDANDPDLQREARTLVDERIESHLEATDAFGFESTFSGRSRPDIVSRAKARGYTTRAVFVGTETHRVNVARVRRRTREGGHDVPESEIIRRWTAAWRNLLESWNMLDQIEIVDNSGAAPRLLASKRGSHIELTQGLPQWAVQMTER